MAKEGEKMRRNFVILMVLLVFAMCSLTVTAQAAVVFQDLGTSAPPTVVGSVPVTAFAVAPQAAIVDGTNVTTIPGSPIPGNLTISPGLDKYTVPAGGWGTWSHGYTGPVFGTYSGTTVTMTLPPNSGAFYFYAEPNIYNVFNIVVVTNSGTTSGNVPVQGDSGANGFGFYTTAGETILTVTLTIDPAASGFAIGEFGVGNPIAPISIPTMTEWGMIIFIVLAGIGSIYYLRRMKRA